MVLEETATNGKGELTHEQMTTMTNRIAPTGRIGWTKHVAVVVTDRLACYTDLTMHTTHSGRTIVALLGRTTGKPELAVAVIYPHGGKHALRKKNLLETMELMQELHLNDLPVYMGGDWNMVINWDVDTANCSSKSKRAVNLRCIARASYMAALTAL